MAACHSASLEVSFLSCFYNIKSSDVPLQTGPKLCFVLAYSIHAESLYIIIKMLHNRVCFFSLEWKSTLITSY